MRWTRALRPAWVDAAVAALLAAVGTYELLTNADQSRFNRGPIAIAALFAVAAPTALRRRFPAGSAVVVAAAAFVEAVFGLSAPFGAFFAILVAAYSSVAFGRRRAGPAAVVALAAAVSPHLFESGAPDVAGILFTYVPIAMAAVAGEVHRRRVEDGRRLAEEAARAAVAEERLRIARDLHDVVSHGLSLIVLHATAAARVMDTDPAGAARSLQLIETTGREGLGELRRMLGVMRAAGPAVAEPLDAHPGLDRLESLAAEVRATGLEVALEVIGPRRPLPQGLEISAFRVVQEALTNVVRHARASRATVAVRFRPGELDVSVEDDGHGGSAAARQPGHGLVGMRERVAMFGGRLDAGPRSAGGFQVRACFPIGDAG